MPSKTIKRILSAKVYDVARETPIDALQFLSEQLGNRILAKREDLQPIYSFKLRGAYNKIAQLSAAQQRKGVVAASAGNHAQGVALSAHRQKTRATIVMPVTTPAIKIRSVKTLGGNWTKVILHGDRFDDACQHAVQLARETGATLVHPYDDPDVIAGQGTIGMEILRQVPGPLEAIFVPVGGGGLIAGIGTYIKYLRPEIRIIGVEARESACLEAALAAGRRVTLPHTGIFADGVAVATIGKETFRLARQCVDEVVTVSNDEICAAVKLIFDDTRAIMEPAGALSLAGLIRYVKKKRIRNKTLVTINSGANVNFDRLRYVSERYGVGQQTEVMLGITIHERAGALLSLCDALVGHDITEFSYRYHDSQQANVFVGVIVEQGVNGRKTLIRQLRKQGFDLVDLSGNELAKLHVLHMVGGRIPSAEKERIFRFEFPERMGILREFLTRMQQRWNISLFHYRQHGGAYANVLIGLQDIPDKATNIEAFLKHWEFPYCEETDNPAYRLFFSSESPVKQR
ncbi:MAG: threonine ammonia-lyase, biosynthetic [Phycisphaerae bacterium]|nr:threonine ammonia-lyase, biosynthetic [Phycisphaerae bacterium]